VISGTVNKLKFLTLKRQLQLPLWQLVGLLETLWHVTLHNTPAGDIGRLTNGEIAAAMEYAGDADKLVEALVETRWIDKCKAHRLVIHDWHLHCPNHLKANFKKYGRRFVTECQGTSQGESPGTVPGSLPGNVPRTVPPSQAKPSQSKPSSSSSSESASDPADAERSRQMMMTMKNVSSCGVADAASAVKAAVANGVSLDAIEAIVAHYKREGGNEPKALHYRISSAVPDVPPEEGWPPRWRVQSPAQSAAASRAWKESEATRIIKAGRKAKKPDDAISAELAAAGLEWPK
jgi:hypothetical protein